MLNYAYMFLTQREREGGEGGKESGGVCSEQISSGDLQNPHIYLSDYQLINCYLKTYLYTRKRAYTHRKKNADATMTLRSYSLIKTCKI